jgi:CheY-like chemotaxis protein
MPGMTGAKVAAEILRRDAAQPLLFVTGYSESDAIRAAAPNAALLSKPFRPDTLDLAVRDAMGDRASLQ